MDWLPWQDGVWLGAATALITVVLGRRTRGWGRAVVTWTRELTVMFALYSLWQYAGSLSVAKAGDAVSRGRDIVRVEGWLHLPTEASVQRLVVGDHGLIRAANYYYAGLHVAVLGVCLVWLFARHCDRYPAVRNVLAAITGVSLLVQLIPVAPPRLVPGLGIVDTGRTIGPSVYPNHVAPGLDQLSAMPSLHVGWAVVVAGAVIYALRSPWRWLAVLYPLATTWVVVVTGNHYWADAGVELVVCTLAWATQGAVTVLRRRAASGAGAAPATVPIPEPAAGAPAAELERVT